MSDVNDIRNPRRESETAFGGDNGEFLFVSGSPPPADEREEPFHQPLGSSAEAAKQPGLIARIGRGVKSAVGGAIGGAINIFTGDISINWLTY